MTCTAMTPRSCVRILMVPGGFETGLSGSGTEMLTPSTLPASTNRRKDAPGLDIHGEFRRMSSSESIWGRRILHSGRDPCRCGGGSGRARDRGPFRSDQCPNRLHPKRTECAVSDSSDTTAENTSSSTLPRRQLGRHLRDWRTQSGQTIAEAARLMEWGASTLQRLEKGQADRIRTIDIQELCRIYGIPGEFAEGLKGLAQQAAVKSWWHAYGDLIPENFDVFVGLEASAQRLTSYQSELVPGLLQTADYA